MGASDSKSTPNSSSRHQKNNNTALCDKEEEKRKKLRQASSALITSLDYTSKYAALCFSHHDYLVSKVIHPRIWQDLIRASSSSSRSRQGTTSCPADAPTMDLSCSTTTQEDISPQSKKKQGALLEENDEEAFTTAKNVLQQPLRKVLGRNTALLLEHLLTEDIVRERGLTMPWIMEAGGSAPSDSAGSLCRHTTTKMTSVLDLDCILVIPPAGESFISGSSSPSYDEKQQAQEAADDPPEISTTATPSCCGMSVSSRQKPKHQPSLLSSFREIWFIPTYFLATESKLNSSGTSMEEVDEKTSQFTRFYQCRYCMRVAIEASNSSNNRAAAHPQQLQRKTKEEGEDRKEVDENINKATKRKGSKNNNKKMTQQQQRNPVEEEMEKEEGDTSSFLEFLTPMDLYLRLTRDEITSYFHNVSTTVCDECLLTGAHQRGLRHEEEGENRLFQSSLLSPPTHHQSIHNENAKPMMKLDMSQIVTSPKGGRIANNNNPSRVFHDDDVHHEEEEFLPHSPNFVQIEEVEQSTSSPTAAWMNKERYSIPHPHHRGSTVDCNDVDVKTSTSPSSPPPHLLSRLGFESEQSTIGKIHDATSPPASTPQRPTTTTTSLFRPSMIVPIILVIEPKKECRQHLVNLLSGMGCVLPTSCFSVAACYEAMSVSSRVVGILCNFLLPKMTAVELVSLLEKKRGGGHHHHHHQKMIKLGQHDTSGPNNDLHNSSTNSMTSEEGTNSSSKYSDPTTTAVIIPMNMEDLITNENHATLCRALSSSTTSSSSSSWGADGGHPAQQRDHNNTTTSTKSHHPSHHDSHPPHSLSHSSPLPLRSVPVVAVGSAHFSATALGGGCRGYVPTPVNPKELSRIVSQLVMEWKATH